MSSTPTSPTGQSRSTCMNTLVGLERKLSDTTRASGAFGHSRLNAAEHGLRPRLARSAWRTRTGRRRSISITAQSFVPQYGFGGTLQNEEVSGHVVMPLARRVLAASWSPGARTSRCLRASRRCTLTCSRRASAMPSAHGLRVEGFYTGVRQTIDRPGGDLNRNRHRRPVHDGENHEDSVMEEPRVHALDYLSVFRRRKWWLDRAGGRIDRRRPGAAARAAEGVPVGRQRSACRRRSCRRVWSTSRRHSTTRSGCARSRSSC